MSHWPTDGREVELVICSPGVGEPEKGEELDPLKHHCFWCGGWWSEEYPNALTWGGDEPTESFWNDDDDEVDEYEYQDYLDLEYAEAEKVLLTTKEIPEGSYIEMGVGYAQKCLFTKGKAK